MQAGQNGESSANSLNAWSADLEAELRALEAKGLKRHLRVASPGIDFASNDYLALNASGRLLELLTQRVQGLHEQVGSTGSRLVRGHHHLFEQVEDQFARFAGQESALLFHSGYAANVGSLQALMGQRDLVFCDRLCHASLLDGVRLSGARRHYFAHNDLNDLENLLQRHQSKRGRRWIVSEALFSMDGDSPDLPALCGLADRHGALVCLDEAHSIGVLGPGLAVQHGLANQIALHVFPCGKAPGLQGAFVAGRAAVREILIQRARSFVFSTAQPPFLAALLGDVLEEMRTGAMQAAREHLNRLSSYLTERLAGAGFEVGGAYSVIVPIIVGEEARALALAERLQNEGLDVRPIRPPTVPAGTSRLRISLHANHRTQDLDRLINLLRGQSV